MPPKNSDILDSFRLCYGIIKDYEKENKMNKLQGEKVDKIEITRYGDEVIAKAFQEGDLAYDPFGCAHRIMIQVGEAAAKCSPNDIFDFNIGAKLAMDRLYEGYDMTPKPKRKPYNGLIYICHYPGYALKDKALYRVIDGKIKGCYFHNHSESSPYIFRDMTDDELSRMLQIEVYGSDAPSAKVIAYFVHNDKTQA